MTLAADLIGCAERIGAALKLPALADVLLPVAPAEAGKFGHFGVLALADGSAGFFYTLLDHTLATLSGESAAALTGGRRVLEIARGLDSPRSPERSLGLAAVNAIGDHLCRRAGYRPAADPGPCAMLRIEARERVGMVGLFPSLVERLAAAGARITVVERDPTLAVHAAGVVFSSDPAALDDCDKVLITAASQADGTLDGLLDHCRRARRIAVVGPSAGPVADVLFARGVDVVGLSLVADLPALRGRISLGQPWGTTVIKAAIERQTYPGLPTLLKKLASDS